jgi:alpha-L-fucosidase
MKQFSILLLAVIFFAACKNKTKFSHTEKNADGTTTTTSVDVASLTSNADEMTKKMEALKKMAPLTLDQLKALLPEEINGIKRTDFNANSTMGFSIAEGTYKKDDSSEIKLAIYDCAGEAGSGMFAMTYWTQMNVQSENADGYVKTVDFNGAKAVEAYKKGNNESSLTYVSDGRLLIILTGKGMDMNSVKQVAQNLNLKTL